MKRQTFVISDWQENVAIKSTETRIFTQAFRLWPAEMFVGENQTGQWYPKFLHLINEIVGTDHHLSNSFQLKGSEGNKFC